MANKINRNAFSVLEISIVLLVLGTIIAGITNSTTILEKYRVYLANKHTENSPAHSTPGLIAWYETTLDSSFDQSEAQNFNDLSNFETDLGMGSISKWYDISGNNRHMENLPDDLAGTVVGKPKYRTNCVNGLPCLDFSGSDTMFFPKSAKMEGDYTVFIVEHKNPNFNTDNEKFFHSTNDIPQYNSIFTLIYNSLGIIRYSHGNLNDYYSISNNILTANVPILHSFTSDFSNNLLPANKKLIHRFFDTNSESTLNEIGVPSMSQISKSLDDYAVIGWVSGGGYNGKLLEVILFDRALKSKERKAIESYLMKKWKLNYNPAELTETTDPNTNEIVF